ncbi:MAG: MerR family transcriptional regulator [Myxococcota bacterium]
MQTHHDASQAVYSIGALASLTGLSPSTIRTWERRYRAVEPARTPGGGRRYTEHDVERVQLLLALTRGGEAISVVAQLSIEALRSRVHQQKVFKTGANPGAIRLALVHRSLGASFAAAETEDVHVTQAVTSLAAFQLGPDVPAFDTLVVELELLGDDPELRLEELFEHSGADSVIVEYGFARGSTLEALAQIGAQVVRGPLTVADVTRLVRVQSVLPRPSVPFVPPSVPSDPPAPRFDSARLARLREMQSTTECECPNHVATLVTALTSFEEYSKTCVSTQPSDAELHAGLAYGTSRARAVMEELLMRLCEYEGIEL